MLFFRRHHQDLQPTRGAMTLFIAAIIIPLLFLFCTFTLDMERYFRDSSRAQHALDQAAMYAYRLLPDIERAQKGAELYLRVNAPSIADYAKVVVTAEGLTLSVDAVSNVSFGSFFGQASSDQGNASLFGLPLRLRTEIRGTPLDALIVMDTSAYLAPALQGAAPWGDASWSAATLFAGNNPQVSVRDAAQHPINGAILTQQCFNPPFAAIKRVTIGISETLAASKQNAVGLGFFPGAGFGVDIAREVLPKSGSAVLDAVWVPTAQAQGRVANDYCLAAVQYANTNSHYFVPAYDPSHPLDGWTAAAVENDWVVPGVWIYNAAYSALKARELIWAQAVRPDSWNSNIDDVVEEMVQRLAVAPALASRGALRGRTTGVGVLVAGDLPHRNGKRFPDAEVSAALRTAVAKLRQLLASENARPGLKVRLYYMLLSEYEGLSKVSQGRIDELNTFLKSLGDERLEIKLVAAPSVDVLSRKGIEAILAEAKVPLITS